MAALQFTEGRVAPPTSAAIPNQLLPNMVDGMAQTRPAAVYAIIPNSFTSYDAGYRKVTYRELASAVNGAAWMLSEQLGSSAKPQALAYVGPNDISYVVFTLAAVKAGHALLLLSPRNTKADHNSLFAATDCNLLLTLEPPYSPTVQIILDGVEKQPRLVHVPTIFQLLDKQHPHFPYPKTFETAKGEPLMHVHTSGTTSTPKLVTYTHAFVAANARWSRMPAPEGYENLVASYHSLRAFTTFPFFHAGGMFVGLCDPVMNQTILVTPLAAVPPSAQGVLEALKHVDIDALHLVAPFFEQIAKNEQMLNVVARTCSGVTYGGGDVSEDAANAFLSRVRVVAGFNGSTETSPYPLIRPREGWDPTDLKYIQPHPGANLRFQSTDLPNLFEAVLIRNPEPDLQQPVFTILPHLQEFRTKDLFSPHPTRSGLWLYRGRADDMIVSATGEMCNPVPFEQAVTRLPEVAAALMVGTGRYQKALIVEPAIDTWTKEEFLDLIWPTIEASNELYPGVSHILRSHVVLTNAGEPLKRAGKGTVQRAPSLALLKERIDALYDSAGDGMGENVEPYKVHVTSSELHTTK